MICQHVLVSTVNNGEDMGWHFGSSFTTVHLNDNITVDGKTSVGIDSHTEKTGVGLKDIPKRNENLTKNFVSNQFKLNQV